MQSMPPLHRVTIGRTRGPRGPDALEMAAAGVLITIAMVFAIRFGIHQMRMTETVEAVSLATSVERNEIVYHAIHGAWPSPGNHVIPTSGETGRYVKNLSLGQDGVITTQLTLGSKLWNTIATDLDVGGPTAGFLSFRPELLGARGNPTVTMLCGYAKPVEPSTMHHTTNKTTLDKRDLPPLCR